MPVICAYCRYNDRTSGPGSIKISGKPASEIQCDSVFPSFVFFISINVSVGLNQNDAIDCVCFVKKF